MRKKIKIIIAFMILLALSTVTTFASDTKTVNLAAFGTVTLPMGVSYQVRATNGEQSYIFTVDDNYVTRNCEMKFTHVPNMRVTEETLEKVIPLMDNSLSMITNTQPPSEIIYQEPITLSNTDNKSIYTGSITLKAQADIVTMDLYYFVHQDNLHCILITSKEEDMPYWRTMIKNMITSLDTGSQLSGNVFEDYQHKFRMTFPDDWRVKPINNYGVSAKSPKTFPSITFLTFPYDDEKNKVIERIREQQSKDLIDSPIISSGETTIAEQPTLWFLHKGVLPNRTIYSYVHFVFRPDFYYTIGVFGNYSDFTEDKPVIQEILNSIILLP